MSIAIHQLFNSKMWTVNVGTSNTRGMSARARLLKVSKIGVNAIQVCKVGFYKYE